MLVRTHEDPDMPLVLVFTVYPALEVSKILVLQLILARSAENTNVADISHIYGDVSIDFDGISFEIPCISASLLR